MSSVPVKINSVNNVVKYGEPSVSINNSNGYPQDILCNSLTTSKINMLADGVIEFSQYNNEIDVLISYDGINCTDTPITCGHLSCGSLNIGGGVTFDQYNGLLVLDNVRTFEQGIEIYGLGTDITFYEDNNNGGVGTVISHDGINTSNIRNNEGTSLVNIGADNVAVIDPVSANASINFSKGQIYCDSVLYNNCANLFTGNYDNSLKRIGGCCTINGVGNNVSFTTTLNKYTYSATDIFNYSNFSAGYVDMPIGNYIIDVVLNIVTNNSSNISIELVMYDASNSNSYLLGPRSSGSMGYATTYTNSNVQYLFLAEDFNLINELKFKVSFVTTSNGTFYPQNSLIKIARLS